VTFAAEAGQLQLNAFEPIIASALFRSFKHLTNACDTLAERCVRGITANPDRLKESIERSIALVTALNPIIGYKAATEVATEAHANGTNVREVVLRRGLMTEAELDNALRHEVLTQPRAYEAAQRKA
jgi:aspartate ammonia-lyase